MTVITELRNILVLVDIRNGSNNFGHLIVQANGLYLASATGRGVFYEQMFNANNFEFTSGGDLKVAGGSGYIFTFTNTGKYKMFCCIMSSGALRRRGTASVSNSGYVHAFRVDGDNLDKFGEQIVLGTLEALFINSEDGFL